ncbi:alpha/beta hydrolase, partial [Listeria monocytogenes]|nr:alpha/beta hydrolase [Listeria monocytogenes]
MTNTGYLKINSNPSSADSIITMKIENLPPLSEVEVFTKTISPFYCINAPLNFSSNNIWVSRNKFISDMNGVVNLNTSPPIYGDYQGAFPMGCISFMKPIRKKTKKIVKDIENIPLNNSYKIEFNIYLNGNLIEKKIIERYFSQSNINMDKINFNDFEARYFHIENGESLPSIIVISGSEGGIEKAQCIAQLLANHGYATLAIGYFGLNTTSKNLSEIPLEIIKEAIFFLKNKKEIDPNRIRIYGRSKGAELALIASNYFHEITCIVLNSPTILSFEGINKKLPSRKPSWIFENKQIDYFRFNLRD